MLLLKTAGERHACVRIHCVLLCGLCEDFPCGKLPAMRPWNPDIIRRMEELREKYILTDLSYDDTNDV